jgi:hypothetical protein
MKSQTSRPNEVVLTVAAAVVAVTVAIGLSYSGTASAFADHTPFPSPSVTPSAPRGALKLALDKASVVAVVSERGGSNVGGANRASSAAAPTSEWCQDSVSNLKAARQMVGFSLLQSDYATAIATYREGIVRSIIRAENQGLNSSLTLNALKRALFVGDTLYSEMLGAADREVRVVDYYNTSYDFLLKVAEEIDLPIYIPYSRSKEKVDVQKYELQFAKYGIQQLTWLLENFTYESAEMYYGQFSSRVYLTLAETITAGVVADLNDSLLENVFACQLRDLDLLSQLLARHNSGDRTVYGGSNRYALNGSASALKDIIAKFNTGCARSRF